jgi:glycosyltransferase involved in cell wall biosynthesis
MSKQPRISLFLLDLPCGGVEQVTLNLAQGFVARGLAVDLILARATGTFLAKVSPQVRVIDLKAGPTWSKSLNLADYLRTIASLPKLTRYLRQEQPIALLAAKDHANVAAIWAKQLAKVPIPVLIGIHVPPSKTSLDGSIGRFMPHVVRRMYPKADQIVAVSHGVAEDTAHTLKLPLERIKVIYNPVINLELLQKAKEPVNHPWFTTKETPIILGVGRLTQQKDFSTLIESFALVRQQKVCRLVILGDGEQKPQLESLIAQLGLESDVSLPGLAENPYAYMAKSDLFVVSSAWEGLAMVLVEALSLGTPVVSTDCLSGPREILQNGRLGPLVPVGDIKALADAMLKTLGQLKSTSALEDTKLFTVDVAVNNYLSAVKANDKFINKY